MAEAPIEETAETDAAAPPVKKKSKLKLILMILIPVLLLGGGGAAAYFMGFIGPKKDAAPEGAMSAADKKDEKDPKAVVTYFTLPEIIVNLQNDHGRPVFLKLTMGLELEKAEDQPAVEKVLPRIVDNFQVYLRELRVDDLRGSAGLYRLREELLMRVNQAVAPVKVSDVLFKEMLVQ